MVSIDQIAKIRQRRVGKPNIVKLKKPPIWHFPSSQEREYMRVLFSLTNELKELIKKIIIPAIPQLISEVESFYPSYDARKDDFQDEIKRLINTVIQDIKGKTDETIAEAEKIGARIAWYNKRQFDRITNSVFGIDIFIDQPWLQDQLKLFASQNAQLIRSIPSQELSQVAQTIERGLQEGSRFHSMTQEIHERFGITRRRAKLIARDQTSKLNASLTKLRQQELGVEEYVWQTAGDERVRPSHRAHDGKKFQWDNPPKDTGHPGTDINCFPGDLEFLSFDGVNKLFRYRYSGELTEVITDNGCILKATPNHPILTNRGWIGIKDIQLGDYIISAKHETFNRAEMDINKDKITFENCFQTMQEFFSSTHSSVNGGKFHGDFSDEKVDIISLDCELPNIWNLQLLQNFAEFIFSWSNIDFRNIFLPTFSCFESAINRLICAPESLISGFSKFFSLLNSELRHTIKVGFGTISNRDIIFSKPLFYRSSGDTISLGKLLDTNALTVQEQHFLNRQLLKIMRLSANSTGFCINTPSSEVFAKIISVYGKPQCDLSQAKPLIVEGHRIIKKNSSEFSDHVYNLETNQGYYGIRDKNINLVVHNCRCVAVPVLEGLLDI